jgi:exodeoxyribonuclease V alpha subunit
VLADVITSGAVQVVRPTEVFRQAAQSQIVVNAHRINAGQMPMLQAPKDGKAIDFYFVVAVDPEDTLRKVVDIDVIESQRRASPCRGGWLVRAGVTQYPDSPG